MALSQETFEKSKIMIILATLFFLAATYYTITSFIVPNAPKPIAQQKPGVKLQQVNINSLVTAHVFGSPPKKDVFKPLVKRKKQVVKVKPKPKKQVVKEKPKKTPIPVNLKVTGIIASNNDAFSSAILKIDNKPETLYRVGDTLENPDIKLVKIDIDSITINNNDTQQVIVMERPQLTSDENTNPGLFNKSNRKTNSNRRNNNTVNQPNNSTFREVAPGVEIEIPPLPSDLELGDLERQEDDLENQLLQTVENDNANLNSNNQGAATSPQYRNPQQRRNNIQNRQPRSLRPPTNRQNQSPPSVPGFPDVPPNANDGSQEPEPVPEFNLPLM